MIYNPWHNIAVPVVVRVCLVRKKEDQPLRLVLFFALYPGGKAMVKYQYTEKRGAGVPSIMFLPICQPGPTKPGRAGSDICADHEGADEPAHPCAA